MAVILSPFLGAGWQLFNNNGIPLSGGFVYTYQAGTTTPQATYTSNSGLVQNANPIQLDSEGRTPDDVWLTEGSVYKFVVKDSNGVLIGTYDNISGINDFSALSNTTDNSKGDALIGYRQSDKNGFLPGAVGSTVNNKLQETVSFQDFGGSPYNTAAQNNTAMTAALTSVGLSGKTLYFPAGTYLFSQVFSTTGHLHMAGDGNSTILDFTAVTSSSDAITVSESTTLVVLSANPPRGVVYLRSKNQTRPFTLDEIKD